MPRMVLPIAAVVVVAGFFLALGYVFIVAGEAGTIVLGLGIILAVLVVAGLRALEGYLNRGGQILGGRISLPQGVMPFWLPALAVIAVAGTFLGLGGLFILGGHNFTIILGLIVIIGVLVVGASIGRIGGGDMRSRMRSFVLITMLTLVGGSFLFVGAIVSGKMLGHYFWPIDSVFVVTPEQPIDFPHPPHVERAGIDCVFCHRTVGTSATASIPPLQQCMNCHQIVATESAEVAKLAAAWDTGEPIQWIRVHRLPDHVRFVHESHISFFTEQDTVPPSAVCSVCHGDVGAMTTVSQVEQLQMGFCVDCHRRNNAPTDCTTCHY